MCLHTDTLYRVDFANIHLQPILQTISQENIQCLKSSTDNESNLFFNSLLSQFFTPYILQPTRLQSKTLADTIFFNSVEHQSNNSNLLIKISDHLIQFLILEGFPKEREHYQK